MGIKEFFTKNKKDICMRVLEWIVASFAIFVFKYNAQFDAEIIKQAFLFGFTLSLIWYVVLLSLRALFHKSYDRLVNLIVKVNDTRITISETTVLQGISKIKPLYHHYLESLDTMTKNIDMLTKGDVVKLTPFNIYDHIISASAYFTKSIRSVDCNINAWINVCEFEDYAFVQGLDVKSQSYKLEKDDYDRAVKRRRRTDSTYQIYKSINDNLHNNEDALDRNPVKRIFLIDKRISELDKEEKMIILRLKKIKNEIRGKIANKILIRDELDSKDKNKLDKLQDIIIFDGVVAYKEYIYREDFDQESEIFLESKKLKEYIQYFEELFEKSKDVNEINF